MDADHLFPHLRIPRYAAEYSALGPWSWPFSAGRPGPGSMVRLAGAARSAGNSANPAEDARVTRRAARPGYFAAPPPRRPSPTIRDELGGDTAHLSMRRRPQGAAPSARRRRLKPALAVSSAGLRAPTRSNVQCGAGRAPSASHLAGRRPPAYPLRRRVRDGRRADELRLDPITGAQPFVREHTTVRRLTDDRAASAGRRGQPNNLQPGHGNWRAVDLQGEEQTWKSRWSLRAVKLTAAAHGRSTTRSPASPAAPDRRRRSSDRGHSTPSPANRRFAARTRGL